jgi:hypothetical protein
MAIVRMNTRCEHTSMSGRRCAVDPCPGSDVYIFEIPDGRLVCSDCSLTDVVAHRRGEFLCREQSVMATHLEAHVERGDHVSPTVLGFFREGP